MSSAKATKEQTMAVKEAKSVVNTKDLTTAEKRALMRQLEEEVAVETVQEFESDVNFVVSRAKNLQRKLSEYLDALLKLMPEEEKREWTAQFRPMPSAAPASPRKQRAARGTGSSVKETADKDSDGNRPIPGTTYVINGTEWTKSASGKGRAKDIFIDAIKGGAKWPEMVKK